MNNRTKENLVSDLNYLIESHADRNDNAEYHFSHFTTVHPKGHDNEMTVVYTAQDTETGETVGKLYVKMELGQ